MKDIRKKVIIIASGPIGQRMAGPAIRSLEIATSLSKNFEVFLVIPNKPAISLPDFRLVWNRDPALKELIEESDGVMILGIVEKCPLRLFLSKKPILVDLYIPYWFELLEVEKRGVSFIRFLWETRLNLLLKRGDFFICASEKQRHLWLGAMAILGRIVPEVYQRDRLGRGLIDVVPFGIAEIPPEKEKKVFKGKIISSTDKLVLWNGGIWRWLDPLTLIKAIYEIRKQRDDIKLLFLGTHYPNEGSAQVEIWDEAIGLAKSLGIYSETIFFNEAWVPYHERKDYLLEADLGVSLHRKSLESLFSFRTRLVDCLWADLPIVCTEGDHFGDLVEKEGLGVSVKPEDVEGVKNAILKIVDDTDFNKKCRENLKRVANGYTWTKCVMPIEAFFDRSKGREKRSFLLKMRLLLDYLLKILWGNLTYRLRPIHDGR